MTMSDVSFLGGADVQALDAAAARLGVTAFRLANTCTGCGDDLLRHPRIAIFVAQLDNGHRILFPLCTACSRQLRARRVKVARAIERRLSNDFADARGAGRRVTA